MKFFFLEKIKKKFQFWQNCFSNKIEKKFKILKNFFLFQILDFKILTLTIGLYIKTFCKILVLWFEIYSTYSDSVGLVSLSS